MQKSLEKCRASSDHLADFETSQTFFCWKEQSLNYKFCTRHIFPEWIREGGKFENQTPLEKSLQLHYRATAFSHFY
jgi:hypothetical protein